MTVIHAIMVYLLIGMAILAYELLVKDCKSVIERYNVSFLPLVVIVFWLPLSILILWKRR